MADKILVEYEVNVSGLKTELKQVEESVKQTEKTATDSAKTVSEGFDKSANSVKSLKSQLRDLKSQIANTTDPKEFERLTNAAGKLQDKINDAADAVKAFANESKATTARNLFGQIASDLANLDFKGASEKSRQFASVVSSITFKGALGSLKDLGKTLLNVGASLVTNPLFLLGGAAAVIYTNWDKVKYIFSETEKEVVKLNKAYEEQKRITAAIVAESERKVKLLEAEGASMETIYLARLESIDAQISEAKALYRLNAAKLIQNESNDNLFESYQRLNMQLSKSLGLTTGAANAEALLKQSKKESNQEARDALKLAEESIKNLSNDVNVLRAKRNKDIQNKEKQESKNYEDYLKTLRDLRTQNIADNYQRELKIIENKFSDEKAKYKGQNDIIIELEKSKQYEIAELNKKYNKSVIQDVDKLISILDQSKSEQIDIQMELKDTSIGIEYLKNQELEKLAQEEIEIRKRVFSESVNLAQQLTGTINEIYQNQLNFRIQNLNDATENEKAALESQLENGYITRKNYDEKLSQLDKKSADEKRKLQEKAFIAQRNASLIQAGISTAQGIANALTVQPATLVPFYIALAAVTGAAQVAAITSSPIPKFEKGGEIGGRLHSQGGTLIEAEKGEFIVNRKSANKNYELIDAINKGLTDKYIYESYIYPALKEQYKVHEDNKNKTFADNIASSMLLNSGKFNDSNLIESLKTGRMAEKNNFDRLIKAIVSNKVNYRDIV